MKHQLHNENRKLTKSQRSEKKRKKLLEDTSRVVHTAVFRVMNLSDSKIRWKIKTNAKQYNLTGCMMLFSRMNMVMVEGGNTSLFFQNVLQCWYRKRNHFHLCENRHHCGQNLHEQITKGTELKSALWKRVFQQLLKGCPFWTFESLIWSVCQNYCFFMLLSKESI